MNALIESINNVFKFVTPVSDFLWDFPTNFEVYKNIPILGSMSLAVILLVGSGIFFSFKLSFVQVRYFTKGINILTTKKKVETGISELASFLLSTAMRVGPGNITGATGAIAIGGPGAIFWMWVSAFFGMATAFIEGTLAQIFKEKDKDEFVGGLPFYGRKLLNNIPSVGVFLSLLYILYAICCLPAQGFNVVTSIGNIAEILNNNHIAQDSSFYYFISLIIIVITAFIVFGGIKKVTKVTDKLVPLMSIVYFVTVLALIIFNFDKIPYFFISVFSEAFKPRAMFGGAFGIALAQGVKRGLMSNEAGQGTITMSASAADSAHPVEQGFVSSLGVFLDTIVICSLTGFVVVMGAAYDNPYLQEIWNASDKLAKFNISVGALTIPELQGLVTIVLTLCFALFAYTCLLGMISFSEISLARISRNDSAKNVLRLFMLAVAAFGILCNIAGLSLDNMWAISDLGNILICYFNIPLLYIGLKYVNKSLKHYEARVKVPYSGKVIGYSKLPYWDSPKRIVSSVSTPVKKVVKKVAVKKSSKVVKKSAKKTVKKVNAKSRKKK